MKSIGIAYLLWFFAVHRFYLGRPVSGLFYIATCGGCGIWLWIDLVLIPSIVAEENAAFAAMFKSGPIVVNVNNGGKKRRSK